MNNSNENHHDLRALPRGYVLSDYTFEKVLGSGSFGITYLALDSMLNKHVAIKEYFPREFAAREGTLTVRPVGNQEDQSNFTWGLKRFLGEARILAMFDHPNIIHVRRFFEANGTAYLVMDYCEGIPLDKLIEEKGSLSEVSVRKLIYPILDALEKVHNAQLLHRDIKPSNIYIKNDGTPVLLDFGAARQEVVSHSKSVTSIVTPGYGALEQYSTHGEQGPTADIYGFGATLYKAITGEKPQDAASRMLEDKVAPLSASYSGKYGTNLLIAIDKAMSIRPQDRPQSISEWRGMLSEAASVGISNSSEVTQLISTSDEVTKLNLSRSSIRNSKNTKVVMFGVLILLVLAVVLVAIYFVVGSQSKVESLKNQSQLNPSVAKAEDDRKVLEIKPIASEVKPKPSEEKKEVQLPQCQGSLTKNVWKNCHGTITFDYEGHVGEKYTGDFDEEGRFTGYGTYSWPDGRLYVGTFKSNMKDGKGTFTTSKGGKYVGEYKADKYHGNGTLIFENGDKYVGTFKNGMFDGRGTYTFPSGQKYVGEYKNDKSNGQGVLIYSDGRKYVGGFENGKFSGFGTYYDAKGVQVYSGMWEDGAAKEVVKQTQNGLTGSIRVNFVHSFYTNCMNNQKLMPENKGLSDSVIGQYCKCSSEYSADLYTNQMVADIEAGRGKIDSSISQATTNYCRANYSKY